MTNSTDSDHGVTNMTLTIAPCTDEDMARAFEIMSLAFADQEPYWDAMYPKHNEPAGRMLGGKRLLAMKKSNLLGHFMKAKNEETGEMIGVAHWLIYNGVISEEQQSSGEYWENEEEKEYAMWLADGFEEPRMESIKSSGGNIVSLNILAVDPKYHKRGAGAMLVRWGVDIADKMGVLAVVESSVVGRRLYEKNGFHFKREVVVPVPEKWEDRPKTRFAWMIRPAKCEQER